MKDCASLECQKTETRHDFRSYLPRHGRGSPNVLSETDLGKPEINVPLDLLGTDIPASDRLAPEAARHNKMEWRCPLLSAQRDQVRHCAMSEICQ